MDFTTIIKAAIELGVVPALALFLVVAMWWQNRRLTTMLEKQENNNMEMLKVLVGEFTAFAKETAKGNSHGNTKAS